MPQDHIHFVTGRFAEGALRQVVHQLAPSAGFDYSIGVLDITIAALMTSKWVARRIEAPDDATRVMVPGYCSGDLDLIRDAAGAEVERGPRDLRELPDYFGQMSARDGYGDYDVEILAEIRNAPELPVEQLLDRARQLDLDGANVIVLGCGAGEPWTGLSDVVHALCDEGHRVAIESDQPVEIEAAVHKGAELVFSVNEANRQHASHWGCEVVVTSDLPGTLQGVEETTAELDAAGIPWRLDPVLDPIGFGFSESIGRFLAARWQWPEAKMLMRVSNVTELIDADSAGIHTVLLGFCQEMGIDSVLTTQETNSNRGAVAECELARQMVYHAFKHHVLPRNLEPGLVMLRDSKLLEHGTEGLMQLQSVLSDPSPRLFAEGGRLHLLAYKKHLAGSDAYDLFEQLQPLLRKPMDLRYAFYLGYEMSKATTALTLGKNYRQDEALDWGMLTVPEPTRRERRAARLAIQARLKAEAEGTETPSCGACDLPAVGETEIIGTPDGVPPEATLPTDIPDEETSA